MLVPMHTNNHLPYPAGQISPASRPNPTGETQRPHADSLPVGQQAGCQLHLAGGDWQPGHQLSSARSPAAAVRCCRSVSPKIDANQCADPIVATPRTHPCSCRTQCCLLAGSSGPVNEQSPLRAFNTSILCPRAVQRRDSQSAAYSDVVDVVTVINSDSSADAVTLMGNVQAAVSDGSIQVRQGFAMDVGHRTRSRS